MLETRISLSESLPGKDLVITDIKLDGAELTRLKTLGFKKGSVIRVTRNLPPFPVVALAENLTFGVDRELARFIFVA